MYHMIDMMMIMMMMMITFSIRMTDHDYDDYDDCEYHDLIMKIAILFIIIMM